VEWVGFEDGVKKWREVVLPTDAEKSLTDLRFHIWQVSEVRP
jgi:hypothetical protein